jgi:hypothetical protein
VSQSFLELLRLQLPPLIEVVSDLLSLTLLRQPKTAEGLLILIFITAIERSPEGNVKRIDLVAAIVLDGRPAALGGECPPGGIEQPSKRVKVRHGSLLFGVELHHRSGREK